MTIRFEWLSPRRPQVSGVIGSMRSAGRVDNQGAGYPVSVQDGLVQAQEMMECLSLPDPGHTDPSNGDREMFALRQSPRWKRASSWRLSSRLSRPRRRLSPRPPRSPDRTSDRSHSPMARPWPCPARPGPRSLCRLSPEAAAITSVSQLTPNTSFGGDIVRIRSGPGGDFGNSLYAVSRGAGDNAATGAINRPG